MLYSSRDALNPELKERLRETWCDRSEALDGGSRSLVSELSLFAARLCQDEAAVLSGIGMAWNNGPAEGHVNRPTAMTRAMFGRAGFDLVRARVVPK
jgi:transposase